MRGYACGCRPTLRRGLLLAGRLLGRPFGVLSLAGLPCTRRWTSTTCPARFFSTCSLHTNRHGQSLFGHLSRRSNCFRRSRTSRLSLTSSASSSVAARCLPFIIRTSRPYTSPSSDTCHQNLGGFPAHGTGTPSWFALGPGVLDSAWQFSKANWRQISRLAAGSTF
jgi:hypothetical protein